MQMQRLRRGLGPAPLLTRGAPSRPDQASADMRVMACIAGGDPLVTLSKSLDGCLAGIAALAPDRFANRRVLHLVSLTWHNENAAYRKRIADAVAGAVRRLAEARFDRQYIRDSVLRLIRFDRHNFMLALDKLLALTFGAERAIADFAPFAGDMRSRSVSDVLAGDSSGGRPA